jgi:hypothetical protein
MRRVWKVVVIWWRTHAPVKCVDVRWLVRVTGRFYGMDTFFPSLDNQPANYFWSRVDFGLRATEQFIFMVGKNIFFQDFKILF